jgi:soluble lytic murein transglycosylase
MTEDRVWERIWLAIDRRNLELVSELKGELPRRERVWVERLLDMHRNPADELADLDYPVEMRRAREIVRHGIARLAREDALAAMQTWRQMREEYEFFGEDENYVLRAVGVQAALQHRPEALEWLTAVSADPSDEVLRQWRVRAAARSGHWPTTLKFAAMLTDAEQADDEWRYWRARGEEETGATKAARDTYGSLSKKRGFYGFLAADRVNLPYELNDTRVAATPEERATVAALPGIRMAHELLILGETPEARRQWAYATEPLDSRGLAVAATIAQEWGWHDRAIRTANQADALNDLELRFPVAYRDVVEENARAYDIDPGWIYGVMRQESMFVPDARSPAGALGLMQLMPRTGKLVARELNMGRMPPNRILDIENNVKLGAGYLRRMLDQNSGNAMLATASYNAGPHRVRQWLPDQGSMSADVWANSIPFSETREYVKNVMTYTTIYEHRLGIRPTRLSARMREVDARTAPDAATDAGADW